MNVVARMTAVPARSAVTTPAPSTDATEASLLSQISVEAVPAGSDAASWPVWPTVRVSFRGDSATFFGALATDTCSFAVTPFWVVTVIVAAPAFLAVTRPAAVTVATRLLLEA